MLFFWYCFDDYVAQLVGNPSLGNVPWWVILVLSLVLVPFMPSSSK
jgi:predicted ABC-type sugar transport system permease subunit